MEHPGFFRRAGPFSLIELAEVTKAELPQGADTGRLVTDVKPLTDAGASDLTFLDNRKYVEQLGATNAAVCLVAPQFSAAVPGATVPLITPVPYRSFALALRHFYPDALHPISVDNKGGDNVDPSSVLEPGVVIEPGAMIGPEAQIGRGSRIAAGAVIGYRVTVGRSSYIGPQATVMHALIGDRVTIHAGVRIGQDGFGFVMGSEGHLKVPQIGRVIIQDDVEIGAGTAIDRGALKDTVIGEGTKIDNLVQIGHNVVIGRNCIIVAQSGIAGSAQLGDRVVMGGQSGVVGHINVGTGAQIAGAAHPTHDVPAGARMGGTPARPMAQWGRELAVLARMARRRGADDTT